MKLKGKIYEFLNMFVPEVKNFGRGLYNYGPNNVLPNELMSFILDSGIAKRCVTKTKNYISSNGFTNPDLAKIKVNKTQTANQLLTEAAGYCAYFQGCAFHISRNGGGGIVEIKIVPFQCVRRTLEGNFEVNLTYGQPIYKQDQSKIYAPFAGEKISTQELAAQVSNQQIKTNGEILYCFIPTADNAHYPVPDYYAGLEDIRSSAELQKFDLETVFNGFLPSAILTLIGDLNDTDKDEKGRTEKSEFDEVLKKFTGQVRDSKGMTGRQKLMVITASSKEEAPVLQTFDTKAIIDSSNTKRDAVDRSVCRLFGIHPVLVGFTDANILGNQQAMVNASNELAKNVDPIQRMLEEAFTKMFPVTGKYEWKIAEYMPVNFIPENLLVNMTQDEIRAKLLNLAPLPRTIPEEQLETLANLQALNPRLAASILNGLDRNTLAALIGIAPIDQNSLLGSKQTSSQ